MKLYYSPGACSMADHIALREAGMAFDYEAVDLHTHRTATGADFHTINPKGYVPALILDDGELLTENLAVLDWISGQTLALQAPGPLGRTRVLEMLTYVSTEIHKAYKPLWHGDDDAEHIKARESITALLQPIADGLRQDYLFGATPTVADFYLFVMLLWAGKFAVDLPAPLPDYRARMAERPAVQAAMAAEGLI